MAYTKTVWKDGEAPAQDAEHLNKLETQYDEAVAYTNTVAATKADLAGGKLVEAQVPARLSEAALTDLVTDVVGEASPGESIADIVWWGDSMTASTAPSVLATLSGLPVFNAGIGGERSYDIAARQGGNPILVTFDGGVIPASGAAPVTPMNSDKLVTSTLMKQGTKTMNPATIEGISGTFKYDTVSARYTFTRTTAGTEVVLPKYPVAVIPAARNVYKNHTSIFWLGRNNASSTDRIMEDVQASIDALAPGKARWLVLGVVNSIPEITGTATHTAILELTRRQKALYGRRFVDIRRLLIDYGLQVANITPTATDTQNINNDTVPMSLRSDSVHLNSIGNQVVARFVMERLVEFGWAQWPPTPLPPITPEETIYSSDSFDARANASVINTTTTDLALGGTHPLVWATSPSSQFTVTNGVVSRGASTSSSSAGLPMPVANYRIDITLTQLSTMLLGVRRTTITSGTDHRMAIYDTGNATLFGVTGATPFTYSPGDRLGVRVIGTTLQALLNDVVVDEVKNVATLTEPGFAYIGVAANTTYAFTDVTIRVPSV